MNTKILVVDSSKEECLFIKNALNEYFILTANDGFDALHKIKENEDINILILDLDLPSMHSFHILGTLKSDNRYEKMRIIILTNEIENEIKGLELGANDYIRRPINLNSLKSRINLNIELILAHQGLTFDAIFKQVPIGITVSHNSDSNNISNDNFIINPTFENFTGRTKDELEKLGWSNITHPEDLKEEMIYFKKLQSGEINSYFMDKRYIKPDGSYIWGHMFVANLKLLNSNNYTNICFVQDITKRKEMEKVLAESERSKAVLLSHLPGLAYRCKYDKDWTMLFVSDGCFDLTGFCPESLLHNRVISFNDLIAPEYRNSLWREWERILRNELPFKYEYEIMTANGERKWVLEMGQGNFNEQGEVVTLEGIILDISDRKKVENSLIYNNEHDIWTDLYNRSYLENLLINDVEMSTDNKRALVGVNLNSMHLLSMTYGFHYGQDLVKKVADALKVHCNNNRQLFKTYEYRFVYYLKSYKGKSELIEFCEIIANTLESLLYMERIGGGIGIVEIDNDNKHNVDMLLKNLLISSERAINIYDRDFSFCFFDEEMHEKIVREEEIKQEISHILTDKDSKSLYLEFQGILDLKTNKICAFEALARINSDRLGIISPIEFIPMAEKTKLIIPLGEKIIIHAFNFLSMLKKNGYNNIKVFLNISPIQLQNKNFVENLVKTMSEMQINPENIVIEITESVFASNYNEMNKILGDIKDIGIHIAIDDFGSGYSSLSRERELNVDCIKIDKNFIDKLMLLNEENSITGDIISMFHKLGHYVVAEGVEHEKQKQYLSRYECDMVQGYLVCKPLDKEGAIKLLVK